MGYELDEATCDGVDNDCNGVIDDGLSAPNADNQQGVCAGALKVCSGASGWTEPDYAMMANFQASEAWCDELDNDCDGEVDEPFKVGGSVSFTDADGSGGLFKNDGCGVGDCSGLVVCSDSSLPLNAPLPVPSAEAAMATTTIATDSLMMASPTFKLKSIGRVFGNQSDMLRQFGMDRRLLRRGWLRLYEEPDALYADENCDGIDGDIVLAVFVSTGGVDNGFCDYASPCATINHALGAAQSRGLTDIYVQAGEYFETVTLVEGLRIFGGYDALWARDQRILEGHASTIVGDSDASGHSVAISATGVSADVEGVIVRAPDGKGTGESSYGVHGVNSVLNFERVTFMQGDGAGGYPGTNGGSASGSPAANGGNGGGADEYFTTCDSTSRGGGGNAGTNGACSVGTSGGTGGNGGTMDTNCGFFSLNYDARSGSSGANAPLYVGGGVGYRGSGGGVCGTGGDAFDGWVRNGVGGDAGSAGTLVGNYWVGAAGGAGGLGEHGGGGGGGGGSGGCDDGTDSYGAGGGGGGAGGCRAPSVANGGGGGGASIGVFTVGSTLTVKTSDFIRGAAGDGGNGGVGGLTMWRQRRQRRCG